MGLYKISRLFCEITQDLILNKKIEWEKIVYHYSIISQFLNISHKGRIGITRNNRMFIRYPNEMFNITIFEYVRQNNISFKELAAVIERELWKLN